MRITERIEGTSLLKAWTSLTEHQKRDIAQETAAYLAQLKDLQSNRMHGLGETGRLYWRWLFPASGRSISVGPFHSDDEIWEQIIKSSKRLPEKICRKLRRSMPPAAPYTFTHGDLSAGNVMVKDGRLTDIIDWELSGHFPKW